MQTKVCYRLFYSVLKQTCHKPWKAASAKTFFQVYRPLVQFVSTNVFYSMWWLEDTNFYPNFSLPVGLVQSPCCCVFWNKCIERIPHNISVISTIILQNHNNTKGLKWSFYFLNFLKETTKSYWKIIFLSATKIGENTTSILNSYFSK